jgi:branched-subunit amino acid ABC-type transport system permease component
MFELLGILPQALFGQLLLGLINGSFYAILSLGLAVIFGLLNIINFTHGAQYMMGAFVAWMLLNWLGLGYWWAFILSPVIVGIVGVVLERNLIAQLASTDKVRSLLFLVASLVVFIVSYGVFNWSMALSLFLALAIAGGLGAAWAHLARDRIGVVEGHVDHLYGLLLTFGLALIIQGLFRNEYGSSGLPYQIPAQLTGGQNLGFMFLPNYRGWVVVASLVVCLATWFVIEKTRLGAYLRAATENATLTQAFGINVPRLVTLTYGFGVGLAAFAGVLAAPIYSVNPTMGENLIIVVFAVVVIGGMGSILGAIVTGFGLGLIEGPDQGLLPRGVKHRDLHHHGHRAVDQAGRPVREGRLMADSAAIESPTAPIFTHTKGVEALHRSIFIGLAALLLVAPFVVYPVFLMKVLCFALFACAFNLLLGYGGLLSFGHAAYFGMASYVSAYTAKHGG